MTARQIVIGGIRTPVHLEDWGPPASVRQVRAFERTLGHSLPASYREFLLEYNGGSLVVGAICGRDDDPQVGYQHGDAVQSLFGLGRAVPRYRRLLPPGQSPWTRWNLPQDSIVIADDEGGNAFVLTLGRPELVRFVNHERANEPFESHRVVADGFLDLLLRIRTIEDDARLKAEEQRRARDALAAGPLPVGAEAQCLAVQDTYPEIRQWVRAAFLRVFDENGCFAIGTDDGSCELLDLIFWMKQVSTDTRFGGISLEEFQKALLVDWRRPTDGLGVSGYAPDLISSWWSSRVQSGTLALAGPNAVLTPNALRRIPERWASRAT